MKIYKIKFYQITKKTPNVTSFRFLPEERIEFLPGQFLKLIFDDKNIDNKEFNKYLSFSSSPTKDYIEVTKRLSRSQFSDRLRNLKLSDSVSIQAPLGKCVFREEYKNIVFLIGGIGITPVISIIEYIVDKNLDTNVSLFYSNQTEEEIAFKKELDNWTDDKMNLEIFYTITDCQPKDKNCIFGRIDKPLLLDKIRDLKERIFFIFGPPKMVEAMRDICREIGIEEENIKTESFIGY